jgi:hypothetical protein
MPAPLKYPGTEYYHALPAVIKTWEWAITCDTEMNVIKNPTEAVPLFNGMYGNMQVDYSIEYTNTLDVAFQAHNHPEDFYDPACFVHMLVHARVEGRHDNEWRVISSPNQHDIDSAPAPVAGCNFHFGPFAEVCFAGEEGIELLEEDSEDDQMEGVQHRSDKPIYVEFKATVWVYRPGDITRNGREIPTGVCECKNEKCHSKEEKNELYDAWWRDRFQNNR